MQFRGHSLPVHLSMSVSWVFTLSHFVSQIRLRDFFRLLAIGMCHFLPVHHFGMACLARSKVKMQQVEPIQKQHYFCYIAGFRSLPVCDFIQKTYMWLEKGSIRPDVSLAAAAKTMNKMCFCARGSAQCFWARMQEINSH